MRETDPTSAMTGEGQAAVFVAVDHGSAECVDTCASRRADRFGALKPVRRAVRERFGAFAKDVAAGLALRHDHGSQYVSHDFQAETHFLRIESSPAFVREPEGDTWRRAVVHAPEGGPGRVRPFATVDELRLAPVAFRRTGTVGRHGYGRRPGSAPISSGRCRWSPEHDAVPHDPGLGQGYSDVFATKLNAASDRLLYSSLLGGNYCDFGNAVAIDVAGDDYVAGRAESHDVPTTAGVVQRHHLGGPVAGTAFVEKLRARPEGSGAI